MSFKIVDFPEPDSPINTVNDPGVMVHEKSLSTVFVSQCLASYSFVTFLKEIILFKAEFFRITEQSLPDKYIRKRNDDRHDNNCNDKHCGIALRRCVHKQASKSE